jgi:tRNA(fMet)-specific endonuclease VapC
MDGRYALDTNIVSALISNESRAVQYVAVRNDLALPSIVIGELYYGAFCSGKVAANLAKVEFIIQKATVLNCDHQTALLYGEIKQRLRKKGRPIPENDVWIAALAMQYETILATRDAHFNEVDGLKIEIP